ncbi:hypothetical protein AQJ43_35800 [Streptomyces avermitilis]|uniref:IS5 family IS4811-like transposase n=2 Tax=Streptomyces avermitilis TaxID=33903 RepID=Q82RV0_STRAW|nr:MULTISPECIES: transposase [Streptomyces]KUN49686.1 hypothetical protein AQJ43_35800 [Streptomyces avermitilis]BAC67752.1 putative IS5 family IS4811-like transposase [Streptomyces avermitilis MA-4680 = NBRC 14893]BBJ47421.1 hypothetical protein SAVMC3_00500 [Streptomyces avermitilis]GDY69053.1 hypothetical protein SAV14893_084460 [Streptomyces avermitilis]GDY70565.1 hypothetical protein SAV31267_000500 [Streptomyces avermitilis]
MPRVGVSASDSGRISLAGVVCRRAGQRSRLPVPAWLAGRGGQPEGYCHLQMIDAVRYLVDNGIEWPAMPADFPARDRVCAVFRRRRDHQLIAGFHDRLRGRVRESEAGTRNRRPRSWTRRSSPSVPSPQC